MKIANRHRRCLLATVTLVVPLNTGVSGKYPFLFPIQWPPVLFLSLPFAAKKKKSQQHSHPHTQTHTHTHTIPELPTTTTNSYNQIFIGARAAPQKPTKTSSRPNRLKLPKSQSTNNPKRKRKRASPRKKEQPSCEKKTCFSPSSSSIIMTFTAILENSSRSLQSLKNHDFYCKP
jgi:hypothetical protein